DDRWEGRARRAGERTGGARGHLLLRQRVRPAPQDATLFQLARRTRAHAARFRRLPAGGPGKPSKDAVQVLVLLAERPRRVHHYRRAAERHDRSGEIRQADAGLAKNPLERDTPPRCESHTARGHSLDASSELPWKNTSFGVTCRWTASIQLIQPPGLDKMEGPTSALQIPRVTLDLRELNAEPHTKEVGHVGVYNHRCVRSARGNDRRRRVVARAPDTCASCPDLRQRHDCTISQTAFCNRAGAVSLRGRALRVRPPARVRRGAVPM